MASIECSQVFKFGPSKSYCSDLMVKSPLNVKRINGIDNVLNIQNNHCYKRLFLPTCMDYFSS